LILHYHDIWFMPLHDYLAVRRRILFPHHDHFAVPTTRQCHGA
jgi:hypothetical protein